MPYDDPTTQREFYNEGSRRKSGRFPRRWHHKHYSSGMLGGDALLQGTEIQDIHMSRGLLPIIGRGSTYRYVIEYRDENRNIYTVEDSRENPWYTDNSRLSRNRSTITEDVSTNTAIVQFPNGGMRQIPEFFLDKETYGAGAEYNQQTPYFDLQKYDPVIFVEGNGPQGMFPEVSNSPSYTSELVYNGVIEPFEIRSLLYQKNTFAHSDPFPGKLLGYAPSLIDFWVPINEIDKPSGGWYEDASGGVTEKSVINNVEVWTTKQGVKQFDPDYITDKEHHIDNYLDRDSYDAIFVDDEMEGVLQSMDSTLDEGGLPFLAVDCTVGFDAPTRERISSIVYRDLLR